MKKQLLFIAFTILIAGCQQSNNYAELRKKELDRLEEQYAPLYTEALEQVDMDRLAELLADHAKQKKIIEEKYLLDMATNTGLKVDAFGPGIHMNQYGQPIKLIPDGGGVNGEFLKIKEDAYGPGIHMDQYGRPVRERPWP